MIIEVERSWYGFNIIMLWMYSMIFILKSIRLHQKWQLAKGTFRFSCKYLAHAIDYRL